MPVEMVLCSLQWSCAVCRGQKIIIQQLQSRFSKTRRIQYVETILSLNKPTLQLPVEKLLNNRK